LKDTSWHQVQPFGSYAQGLFAANSDLDITLVSESSEMPSVFPQEIVTVLLKQPNFSGNMNAVGRKCPVLSTVYDGKLEVDLTIDNHAAIKNSDFLKAYMDISPIVPSFCTAIKSWAKASGVCGGHKGCLSSYSFTLLGLYYLQMDPEVSLPVLPLDGSSPSSPPTWESPFSLPTILARFFYFYSKRFHWGFEVVSIRVGERLIALHESFESLDIESMDRLHIEDPFIHTRNLNCVLWHANEQTLKLEFKKAFKAMLRGDADTVFGEMTENQWPGESLSASAPSTKLNFGKAPKKKKGAKAVTRQALPGPGKSIPRSIPGAKGRSKSRNRSTSATESTASLSQASSV